MFDSNEAEYGDAPDDDEINGTESLHSPDEEQNGSPHADGERSYFKNFKMVFNQTAKVEAEIKNQHKKYR